MDEYLPKRPYLIRAMHEWITDNGLTPHIVVDAVEEELQVPGQYISEGKVVFNISSSATRNLVLDNKMVTFQARFEGVNRHISVPTLSVISIYARETGQGIIFTDETDALPTKPSSDKVNRSTPPSLKVVK